MSDKVNYTHCQILGQTAVKEIVYFAAIMSDSVTEEQRAYHLKKMRTRFARLDLNKDGFISHEDYELMGKRLAEHGNLTKEQAESVHKSLMVIADNIVQHVAKKFQYRRQSKKVPNRNLTVLLTSVRLWLVSIAYSLISLT